MKFKKVLIASLGLSLCNITYGIEKLNNDELLPIMKSIAKETLADRFNYCTDWLRNNVVKSSRINPYNDYIDWDQLNHDIEIRKQCLNDLEGNINQLNNLPWSSIPINIDTENTTTKRRIFGKLLWFPQLYSNYWTVTSASSDKPICLQLNCSYELHDSSNLKNIDDEEVLATCLSEIEMDLSTAPNLYGESIPEIIKIFFYYLGSRVNDNTSEIARYNKYFTKVQNDLLAKQMLSYYLVFPSKHKEQTKLCKYLAFDIIRNAFKETNYEYFIFQNDNLLRENVTVYLQDNLAFGSDSTKIVENIPKFAQEILNDNTLNLKDILISDWNKYSKLSAHNAVKFRHSHPKYNNKIISSLNVAGSVVGTKVIDNILDYLDPKAANYLSQALNKVQNNQLI